MRNLGKISLIFTAYAIPVLLILSGLTSQPNHTVGKNTVKTATDQRDVSSEESVFANLGMVSSVQEYEALSKLGNLPNLYSGLSIDGELNTDENGNLIVNEGVRQLFDFFLSARQTEGVDLCFERISEYIDLTLSGKAAEQAHDLKSKYKQYLIKSAEFEIETAGGLDFNRTETALMKLKEIVNTREKLCHSVFGKAIANQLFENNHQLAKYTLNRIEISQNPTLSADEKALLSAEELQALPLLQQSRLNSQQLEKTFEVTIENLQKLGNVAEIYNLRKERYGEAAAKRLTALDTMHSDLQERIERFLTQKKRLLKKRIADSIDVQYELQKLRNNSFEEWELSALQKAEANSDRQG